MDIKKHSDGVIDCCLMPNEQFFSYIMTRTSYNRWHDDDVRFVFFNWYHM